MNDVETHANEVAARLEARGLLDIAREVAARHHVTLDELLGRSRFSAESTARRELCARLLEIVHSSRLVGLLLDRDSSTVRVAARAFKDGYRWRGKRLTRPCIRRLFPQSFPAEGRLRCADEPATCSEPPHGRVPARVANAREG